MVFVHRCDIWDGKNQLFLLPFFLTSKEKLKQTSISEPVVVQQVLNAKESVTEMESPPKNMNVSG